MWQLMQELIGLSSFHANRATAMCPLLFQALTVDAAAIVIRKAKNQRFIRRLFE